MALCGPGGCRLRYSKKHGYRNKGHETGELPTWVAKARCINEGMSEATRRYRFGVVFGGRVRWTGIKRLQIAERQDAGEISEAEAKKELKEFVELCWVDTPPPECRIR